MDINIASSSSMVRNKVDLTQAPLKASASDVQLKRDAEVSTIDQTVEQSVIGNEQDPSKLNQVATDLSDMMSMMRKGLAFKVDETSGQAVVTVLDRDTGDVIRQMPTEEALALAEKLSEVTGLLMKTEA
ncbi:flagellar protein FlaG [Shewanella baltica]|uniref:Flagellar protein FlaG protein n=1 Tax=Shewanella baltica (strain OS155 / ATCC BAA-1091) TaxID=325240 RepID=A3D6Q3_SHEB5|nr:flagellar protein FlaG [Shewanella baltica]ABN62416.1 flagellar protein FlaG protein [Shewanella baltica OS155]AEG10699.1 flagellar protein FlaG protein [Shewanella baltica BA175]AEH14761.1 flagellar protein FlaG protein [Shewanella baltica OS117]EHQ15765.1 flagellar protein FlaG protein [Shewanella baltica OS183]MCS6122041.1 flagellar protein FlaG [Shewanella baltica]